MRISMSDLVSSTGEELGISRADVRAIVNTFFEHVEAELSRGNEVTLTPYVAFRFRYSAPIKKGTMVRNPFDGSVNPSAGRSAKLVVRARALKRVRDAAPGPSTKAGKPLVAGLKK